MKRFVAEDPIGLGGGSNGYAYVRANPVNDVDPLGLWSFSLEAYDGIGGMITFGQDPATGKWFWGGVGGGWNIDPDGKRPGASDDCKCSNGTMVGGYGHLGLGLPGIFQWNPMEFQGGHDFGGNCPDFSEPPHLGNVTIGALSHFEIGGAVGIQAIGH